MRAADDSGIYAAFTWVSDENMQRFIDYTPPESSGKLSAKDKARLAFTDIFTEYEALTHSQLKLLYVQHRSFNGHPIKEDSANNHIRDGANKWNFLIHENGLYRFRTAKKNPAKVSVKS